TPDWTAESNVIGADFGNSVASAGDVNGDGYSDVIIGSDLLANGNLQEGAAFVYLGNAGGLDTVPAWTVEGEADNVNLGAAVATAGDVDGDGFSDVLVCSTGFTNPEISEGQVALYAGG